MVFGVLAGVVARAMPVAQDHFRCSENICAGEPDCHEAGSSSHDGKTCPESKGAPCESGHCHHSCNHATPLTLESSHFSRVPMLDYMLAALETDGSKLPDSPLFELDTPPLI